MPRDFAKEGSAWERSSGALAAWSVAHLVNRNDVWGEYVPVSRRGPGGPKSLTAPRRDERGSVFLTTDKLAAHFAGRVTLGLHASNGASSRWLAFDLDAHDGSDATRNLDAAHRLSVALREAGAAPLVEDSDGRGGLHVWVVLDAPAPTADVFGFSDTMRSTLGLGSVETFPKQASIPAAGCGNWLRLPGRHHTRDHWSRVASGGRWLTGAEAVRALLTHPLTPASCIPAATLPTAPTAPKEAADRSYCSPPNSGRATARLAAYCARVDHGLSDGRKRKAFALGAAFVHDFALAFHEARALLDAWNGANVPPLDDTTLGAILANAARYGRGGRAA